MSDLHDSINDSDNEMAIDLRQLLKMIKKWKWMIVIVTLLITLLSGILSYYVLKPVYQAKTLLMVTVASEKLQVTNQQLQQLSQNSSTGPMPLLTMNTYLGQLQSDVVMNRVITALNLDQTPSSLASTIDANIVKDSNLIEVRVSNHDPVMAATIANTISEEYLNLMKEYMFSSVVVISPANVPMSPIKPNKRLNIAVSFLFGLILSIFIVYVLEFMDNTFKTSEIVEAKLRLPVLGVIPAMPHTTSKNGIAGGKS